MGGEGRRLPAGMAINGHAALMEIKGGGVLRRGNGRFKRGNEGGASLRLDCEGLMEGERRTRPVTASGNEWGRGHPAAGGRGRS
jgi:hypothetical protein